MNEIETLTKAVTDLSHVRNQALSDMMAIHYAIEEHVAAHGFGWPDVTAPPPPSAT